MILAIPKREVESKSVNQFFSQDQDQAQVENSFTIDYNYLTIYCWYLIKYIHVLQTSFLYERKVKFYSCDP